jgi:hypothetical protein
MIGELAIGELIKSLASIFSEAVKARLKPGLFTRGRMFGVYKCLRSLEKDVGHLEAFLASIDQQLAANPAKRLPNLSESKFEKICVSIGQNVETLEIWLSQIEVNLEIYKDFLFVRSLRLWIGGESSFLVEMLSGRHGHTSLRIGTADWLPALRKELAELARLRAEMASFLRENYKLSDA